jgi:hypothetical protein
MGEARNKEPRREDTVGLNESVKDLLRVRNKTYMIRGLWEEMVQPDGVAHLRGQSRDEGPDGVKNDMSNSGGEIPRAELADQQFLGKISLAMSNRD